MQRDTCQLEDSGHLWEGMGVKWGCSYIFNIIFLFLLREFRNKYDRMLTGVKVGWQVQGICHFFFTFWCCWKNFNSETLKSPQENLLIHICQGAWVTQSVKHSTLDFDSAHDLTVYEFKPHTGLCAKNAEPAWGSLSLLSLTLSLSLSLSI